MLQHLQPCLIFIPGNEINSINHRVYFFYDLQRSDNWIAVESIIEEMKKKVFCFYNVNHYELYNHLKICSIKLYSISK